MSYGPPSHLPPRGGPQQPPAPPYGPPPPGHPGYPQPPAKKKFWTPATIVIVALGGLFVLCGGLYKLGSADNQRTARQLDVRMTGCTLEGSSSLPSAKVSFTVTNNGTTARQATVRIEYRDAAGARVDTDTSYVSPIAPGDTVRQDETTLLNAAPPSITCAITGVS